MKAVFLSYNQALTDRVNAILDEQGIRGFTRWALTEGRGSFDGEPHYGTHAWPSMNASLMAIVDDEKVAPLMEAFREMDAATKMQGSRAFVWNIEQTLAEFSRVPVLWIFPGSGVRVRVSRCFRVRRADAPGLSGTFREFSPLVFSGFAGGLRLGDGG